MLKLLKAIAPDTSFESLGEVMAALGDGYDSLVALASTVKTLVGATVSQEELIKRWNEIEAWLNGVTDSDTLSSLLESQRSQLTADIDAVRAKAEEALSGATVTFDTAIESAGTVDPKLIATASAGGGVVLELNTSRFLYRSASGIYFAKWTATDGVDVKPRSAYYDGASVAKSRLYLCRADGSVYSWSDGQKLLVRVDMAAAADAAEAKTIANAALSKSRRRPLRVNPLLHRGHIHVGASKGEVYQWHGFVKANLCVVKGSDDTRGYVAWDDESETVKIDLRRFAGFIATAPVVTVVERGDDRSPDTFTRIQSSWDPLASTMTLNVPQGSRRERRTALIPLTGINHRYVMIGADNQLTPAYGVESVGRSLPPADVAVVAMLEDALANGTSFGSLIASLVNRAPCDQTPRWEIAIRRRRHTLPKDADSIADHLHIVWKRICGNGISSWANPGNALYVEGKIPRMTCGVLRMRRVTAKGWLRSPWVYVSWCRLKGSDKFHYKVL
jgi:hypothetical protein